MQTSAEAVVEARCPLCCSDRSALYVWAPSHYGPELHRVTRCGDCGMIYTNPQPATYEDEVKHRGPRPYHFDPEYLGKARRIARLQLATLAGLTHGRRILDFGCGSGAFVKEAIDLGWDALGVDLNEGLVEAANRHWGFDALLSLPLDEMTHGYAASFDAVMSNQVFEHLHDPLAIGAELLGLLRPGGVLYIDVPNAHQPAEWFQRGKTLDPTAHWNHFTIATLTKFIERLGCRVVYASAAPSLVELYRRFTPPPVYLALARLSRRMLPPIGSGVCVIGRKPEVRSSTPCAH